MYDLVVIGAGPEGLSVAIAAAKVGAKVALVDKTQPGGGRVSASVPSKGLVQAARLKRQVDEAGAFGIQAGPARVDLPAILARLREVSQTIAARNSDEVLKLLGIDVFHGSPSFEAYDTVLLDGQTRIEGHRFVIATGSRPLLPDIPGLAEPAPLDDTSLWSLDHLPPSLIVIGAGPVALEFAQAFVRLGSKVTILTDQPNILPHEDPEASGIVARVLASEGLTIHSGVVIKKIETRGDLKVCVFQDSATGKDAEAAGSEILCTSGRLANVEGLNLEAVDVHADPQHGIEVDDLLQTHSMRVFAVGDVLLRALYVDAAEREAEVAFQNAVLRRRKKIDYSGLPWTTFVDPEVASVGISEAQAKAEELDHQVYRARYADLDRALIDGKTEGFAKVVTSPSGKILGATVVGEQASLVLEQLVVAREAGLSLGDLARAAQIYPTYAGLIRDLAGQYRATRLGRGFIQSALKLFYGFQPRVATSDGTPPAPAVETESNGSHHAEPAAHVH